MLSSARRVYRELKSTESGSSEVAPWPLGEQYTERGGGVKAL